MPTKERFGDRRLVNGEIAPVPTGHRILKTPQLLIAWAAVGMVPASYAFVVAQPRLSFGLALGILAAGTLVAALVGSALARSARRYGIGFVALSRAAFGPRGARPILLFRWLFGVAWLAAWALETATWARRLMMVGPLGGADGMAARLVDVRVLGASSLAYSTWVVAGLLLLCLWPIARRGMSGLRRWAVIGAGTSFVTGCALIVFAGIRSQGFGEWITRPTTADARDLVVAFGAATLVAIPGLLAAPDWARFRDPARRPIRRLVSSFPLVPAAVALAFVGALVASASVARRGSADGSPIPDAAGFGGVDAGLGGLLFVLGMWFAAGPALGVYSPALALSGLWPRRIGYRRAIMISMAVAILMVPGLANVEAQGRSVVLLLGLAAPLLGILMADELVLRRGAILLEDLYLFGSDYGPSWGHTFGAWLALLAGWALHPWAMELWLKEPPVGLGPWVSGIGGYAASAVAGAFVAAALYLPMAHIERKIGRALHRRLEAGRKKKAGLHRRLHEQANQDEKKTKKKKGSASEPGETSLARPILQEPTAVTDPHFEYDDKGDLSGPDDW